MSISDWIPALTTNALLLFVAWLSKSLIITRLTKSVQHEFDERIENLKAEHQKNIEQFRHDISVRDAHISSLRDYALSELSSKTAVIDKRRIKAVDHLWAGVLTLAPLKYIAYMIAPLNFDKALSYAESNQKMRDMFSMITSGVDLKKISFNEASKSRLYVTEMAWAIYLAYQSILGHAVIKMEMLKSGLNEPKIIDHKTVSDILKKALPEYSQYLDENGDTVYHHLLDILETRLIQEIRNSLRGAESSKESIELATSIIAEASQHLEESWTR